MTRRSSRRSTVAVRQGVLGLALGLPFIASPLRAQETPAAEPIPIEESVTETETIEVEPVAQGRGSGRW